MRLRFPSAAIAVLPDHEAFDQAEQPLALGLLVGLGGELLRMRGRVIDQLREQHRPGGRSWLARPPQVQRGGVPVADRLLPRGLPVDRLQWQGDLDQLLLHAGGSQGSRLRC
jgi:hypothetical protein